MVDLKRVVILGVTLAAAVLVLVLQSSGAAAATITCAVSWIPGPGTGVWQDAANWSTNTVPGPSDNVCIGTNS